jgi:hypothetical protein
MKKLFLTTAVLIGLLAACPEPSDNHPDDNHGNPVNPGQKTVIVFDNTKGICTAVVYNDYRRRDEDKIAEIPAGASSQEIEWTPGTSVPFYFLYRIKLKGISGLTLNYTPEIGKDQTAVRIDANTKTTISVPKLNETLSSPDTLLSNNSYILIQNNSSYSFQLHRGSSPISPDDSSSPLVISGERARYTINPGAASNYRLLVGADYVTFSGSLVSFEAGRVYSFVFDGGVNLVSEIELKLENVAGVSPNKPVPQAPGAPVIIASDRLLTVHWTAVENAENYDIYISTAQTPPVQHEKTVPGTTTVLTGLTNKATYYVWVKAVNENGSSDFSPRARGIPWPANEVPAVPGRPVIIPGINQLTVNWEGSGGASSYEVYINTTTTAPSSAAVTSDKTNAVINNLQNDVIYYIWVRAVNSVGKSGYSPVEAGTPRLPTVAPAAPDRPILIAGSRELSVSWQAVELASAYEVWFGTSDNSAQAQKYGGDITGGITETIITSLVNEQTYYVWIKAKNVVGTSGFSPAANGKPLVTPGLYRGNVKIGTQNLSTALSYISFNAVSGDDFYIVLGADESASPTSLNYSGKTVGITLLGHGGERTITLASNGSLFTISSGVTLTLDENITLMGLNTNTTSLVYLSSGNLIINTGAKISGNTVSAGYGSGGGGISIYNGTFTMNGGTISGNISDNGYGGGIYIYNNGTFTMNGGAISGNTASGTESLGGGIYIRGTFTMTGGIISGNTVGLLGGGIFVSGIFKKLPNEGGQNSGIIYGNDAVGNDVNGMPLKNTSGSNSSHAVHISKSPSVRRNTTAGQTDHIDSTTGRGLSENGEPPYGE